MRQSEYLSVIKEMSGVVPDVPNTIRFRKCLDIASTMPVEKFQIAVREILKKRNLKCPELLESEMTPYELKHICYTLNLSTTEYETLFNFLKLTA